jgi:cobalt-zinc-cadmium efflux system outer membrane protein
VARRTLAATWGTSTAALTGVRGELAMGGALPSLEHLLERLPSNPDVTRADARLARQDAALHLERAKRVPDVTVRLAGRRFNDTEVNALVAELSVPLPLFDRNQGKILAAEHRLAAAAAEHESALIRSRTDLGTAYDELCAARARATGLDRDVIPHARAALNETRGAFRAGVLRSLDVLDAQRTLFELEAERLDALARYYAATADVERLIGAPLDAAAPAEGKP